MTPFQSVDLLAQFHDNQSLWLARLATGDSYPQVPHPRLLEAVGALAVMPGHAGVVMLPTNVSMAAALEAHNEALAWLRHNRARDVLVWNMEPHSALDLEFLAQGYRPGFEPWWMTRDLTRPIPLPNHLVQPATDTAIDILCKSDVPYVITEQIPAMRNLVSGAYPEVIWMVAYENRRIVGHALVNLADDHAGLFNVGVSGRHRHRGIGTSLTLAAMHAARERGAEIMNLNSTPMGKGMYERIGFTQFGIGQTWVRPGIGVHEDAPVREQQIARMVGTGDIHHLGDITGISRLECGLSLQEFAARFDQKEMLRHLIEHGQTPDIIALWRLGMKNEAIAATRNPAARSLITGSARAFPIHHAVEMGAGTLVLKLIEAGADLSVRDGEYNATPLDWAHATNKPTIARIIRGAGGK